MSKQLTFEQALARCLDDMARTGDIEASLRPYPRWTDRLRPLLETAQAARRAYCIVPEPPGGLADGRARMLAAASQRALHHTAPTVRRSAPRRFFIPRWAAVMGLVLMSIIVLGGGIVRAAADSLPGDWLYPVKWTVEDARMAFASGNVARTHLALEFVGERVTEMQVLVEAERPVYDEVVTRMAGDIERALVQAAWAPDADFVGLLVQITESSRVQVETLEEARQVASPAAEAGIIRAIAVCQQGGEAAAAGLRDPQAFRQRYRHQEGDPTSTASPTVLPAVHPASTDTPLPLTASPAPTVSRGPHDELTPTVPFLTAAPQRTPQGPHPTATPMSSSPGPQSTSGVQHTPAPSQPTGESPTPQGPSATGVPAQIPQGPPSTPGPKKQD